jgi:enolase
MKRWNCATATKSITSAKGFLTAVNNVNTKIAAALTGEDATDQIAIDSAMIVLDGSDSKKNPLAPMRVLRVSLAVARAAANAYNMPLYRYVGGSFARCCPCQ